MKNILEIRNVEKHYGNNNENITRALKDVSFTVAKGEFIGIMGASGSGKTTLLNCISTIDSVSTGHIYLNDKDTTILKERELAKFRRENLGFIFQDFNLLDTLSLYENIALALSINGIKPAEIKERVHGIAKKLGIESLLAKYPYQVSGGQKQRCACARAMIHNPKLILADEPTGALDSHSAKVLLDTLHFIHSEFHTTILMVTHDAFAASYTNRILFLKDGSIHMELHKGEENRGQFFCRIMDGMTTLGGGMSDE